MRVPGGALLLSVGLAACNASAGKPAASPTPSPAAATQAAPEPDRLVALWVRTDTPYLLSIESVTPEGKLLARYLNPRPINVSRAEWRRDAGRLALVVELNDRGYPGSYYELQFDPVRDTLYGVYHHLGLGQNFDVLFTRQALQDAGGAR